jgi:hypothetical protein
VIVVWKELVALAPLWVACAAATAAGPWLRGWGLEIVGPIGYVLGSVALGAHSVGHEYGYRTLGPLLVLPVPRWRILSVKLAALFLAVAALTAIAWVGPHSAIKRFPLYATFDTGVLFLPALMGLTIAPYLTLVTRNTLAGVVFTFGLPGVLLVAVDLGGTTLFGLQADAAIDRFKYVVLARTLLLTCAFAAAATWIRFARLEVVDGGGRQLTLPTLGTSASGTGSVRRPVNALWMLIEKEFRLQQTTFIVIALYLAVSLSSAWLEDPARLPMPWQQLNVLYLSLLAILTGALTSAEERQLGTLEWHLLLPLATWKQFAVKVGVAITIVVAGGVLMPLLAAHAFPLPYRAGFPPGSLAMMSVMAAGITAGSIYVSTLSSSGVRALVTTLPVVIGAWLLLAATTVVMTWAVRAGLVPRQPSVYWHRSALAAQATLAITMVSIATVFLALAYANHRGQERNAVRVAVQFASIGATVVGIGGILFVLGLR